MKTNFKAALLGLALFASVTGAFATEISNVITGKKLAPYSWQKYTRSGALDGDPVISDSNPFPECSGAAQVCTIGTDQANPAGPSVTLRFQ